MSDESSAIGQGADRSPYVESQVIMTTVRIVAPFAFTYGLFLAFHGGGSPGGGFQGGAIVGATVLMIAFAFGIEPTREWLSNRVVAGLVSAGVVAFALIGLIPLLFNGRFLEHWVYYDDLHIHHGEALALEAVEIVGITPIVAAAVVGLFFAIAAGTRDSPAGSDGGDRAGGTVASDDAAAPDGGAPRSARPPADSAANDGASIGDRPSVGDDAIDDRSNDGPAMGDLASDERSDDGDASESAGDSSVTDSDTAHSDDAASDSEGGESA